jgi:hypothetical protein
MSTIPPHDSTPRKAISRRLRFEILRRDNNTCRYCHATDTPLVIDHVLPVALGGTDDPSNLAAACRDCNAGKTSTSPDAALVTEVDEDAARWAAAMKHAAEQLAANKSAVDEQLKPWFDAWFIHSGPGWSYKLPGDANAVLRRYLAAGMPVDVLVDAARVALKKRDCDGYFRYFQGVANNWLKELQADAAALLAAPATPVAPDTTEYDKGFAACWNLPEVSYGLYQYAWLARVTDDLTYNITLVDV